MNDIHPHVCSSFYFAPFHSSLPHLSTRFHPFLSLAVFPSTHRNCLFFHPSPFFFNPFLPFLCLFRCLFLPRSHKNYEHRWREMGCKGIIRETMLEYTFDRIYRFNERLLVYWDFGWERECMDGEIGGGGVVLVRWLLLFPVREIKV